MLIDQGFEMKRRRMDEEKERKGETEAANKVRRKKVEQGL